MRFIIEIDGCVLNVRAVLFQAYREAADAVGWACLREADYWRLARTKGRDAVLLAGAKPAKLKAHQIEFDRIVETDPLVGGYEPHSDVRQTLARLRRHGPCLAVTAGSNIVGRRRVLERAGLTEYFDAAVALHADPRRRPGELAVLAAGDRRTIVAASSDALARSASQADLFTVGIASGACIAARLQQAGVGVVFTSLEGLSASLSDGGCDLIRAGLMPAPLD